MLEVHLGAVGPESSHKLLDVLGESIPSISEGRFEVIGRINERSRKLDSGALAHNIGNDQWHVQLLNAHQLAKLVHSDLVELREGVAPQGNPLGEGVVVHIAGTLLGVAGGVALAIGAAELAGVALDSQADPEARRIGQRLAAEGVGPQDRGRVRDAVTRSSGVERQFDVTTPSSSRQTGRADDSSFRIER